MEAVPEAFSLLNLPREKEEKKFFRHQPFHGAPRRVVNSESMEKG